MKRVLTILVVLGLLAWLFKGMQWFDGFHLAFIVPVLLVACLGFRWWRHRVAGEGTPGPDDTPWPAALALAVVKAGVLTVLALATAWAAEKTDFYEGFVDHDIPELSRKWDILENARNYSAVTNGIEARLKKPISDEQRSKLVRRLVEDLVEMAKTTSPAGDGLKILKHAIKTAQEHGEDSRLPRVWHERLAQRQALDDRVADLRKKKDWERLLSVVAEASRRAPELRKAYAEECLAAYASLVSDEQQSLSQRLAVAVAAQDFAQKCEKDPAQIIALLKPLQHEVARRESWTKEAEELRKAGKYAAFVTMAREELARVERDPHRYHDVASTQYKIMLEQAESLSDSRRDQIRILGDAIVHAKRHNLDVRIAQSRLDHLESTITADSTMAIKQRQIDELTKRAKRAEDAQKASEMQRVKASLAKKAAEASLTALREMLEPVRLEAGTHVELRQVHSPYAPMLLVDISVTRNGKTVNGLRSKDFRLHGNSQRAFVTSVWCPERVLSQPLEIALLIDTSGSMEKVIDAVRDAFQKLMTRLGANHRFHVYTFSSSVKELAVGTIAEASAAVRGISVGGETALWDGLHRAATDIGRAKGTTARRVIVLLSDGQDSAKGKTVDQALAACRTANARVFALGLGTRVNTTALGKVAAQTGGMYIGAARPGDLADAMVKVSRTVVTPVYRIAFPARETGTAPWKLIVGSGPHAKTLSSGDRHNATAVSSKKLNSPPFNRMYSKPELSSATR